MTQRLLTADEILDARVAYNAIGRLYRGIGAADELVKASVLLADVIENATTDGKPLRNERVPTKGGDIGKPCKVRAHQDDAWQAGWMFCGFASEKRFLAENKTSGAFGVFRFCIIDEGAAQ